MIPHIVWQNLNPMLGDEDKALELVELVTWPLESPADPVFELVPRVVERLLGSSPPQIGLATRLTNTLGSGPNLKPVVREAVAESLAVFAAKMDAGELRGADAERARTILKPMIARVLAGPDEGPLYLNAALVAATWKDPLALKVVGRFLSSPDADEDDRLLALSTLVAGGDDSILGAVEAILIEQRRTSAEFRGKVLAALDDLDSPKVPEVVLRHFPAMEPEIKPKAIELLTQRAPWSKALVAAIEAKLISKDALNTNQIRKLLASKDADLARSVKAIWGTIREGRNPQREAVIGQLRNVLRNNPGDPKAGALVFKNLCAQCHKIYGEGQEVGPDLTSNGRASFEQLLSNALDPSLVIGEAYQATSVVTNDGRVLTGLRVEDTPQRVVLKLQGGKVESIPRDAVDEMKVGPLSMMPEDLEKQLKPQEIVDLFAFLALDKPPTDASARRIPGTPETLVKPGEASR